MNHMLVCKHKCLSRDTWHYLELSGLSGTIWSYLDATIWSYLELPGCSYLELPGAIWCFLKLSGTIWSYLQLSAATCNYLDLSASYLQLSGPIWICLDLSAQTYTPKRHKTLNLNPKTTIQNPKHTDTQAKSRRSGGRGSNFFLQTAY